MEIKKSKFGGITSKFRLLLLFCLVAGYVYGQSPGTGNEPSAILDAFKAVRASWYASLWGYAAKTFGLLAFIDVLVMGTLMVVEGSDFYGFTAKIVRKMLVIGAFYALLLNGNTWIPWIIDSFAVMGQAAAASGPLSPSSIFIRGCDLMGKLDASASSVGFLSASFGTALSLEFAAITAFLAFTCICIEFTVVTIESYILVGAAAPIFLGFGGSRWTQPYVERVISLAIAIGVKLLCVYLTVGLCMQISASWLASAASIASSADPAMTGWEIAGSALILLMISWRIPKFFGAVLGGTPAFTGGDLVGTPLGLVSTALGAASLVAGGAGAVGGAVAGGAGGVGSSSIARAAALPAASSGGAPAAGPSPFGPGVSGTTVAAASAQPAPPVAAASATVRPPSAAPPSAPGSGVGSLARGMQKTGNLAAESSRLFDSSSGQSGPGLGKGE